MTNLSGDHVVYSAGCTDHNVLSTFQLAHILPDAGASNAGVAVDAHVVTKGHNDLLDLLGQLTGGGKDQSLNYGNYPQKLTFSNIF